MKRLFLILSIAILGCSSPVGVILGTPTLIPTLAQTPASTQTPPVTAEPGTEKNPLILALGPSSHPSDEMIAEGEKLAAFIESRTGYRVVTVAPLSESALVDAFAKGNAHIASLSPFGYLLARENNSVTAMLASVHDGQMFYGTQFIINRESEFTLYFDPIRNENTENLETALGQFADKKPCWSDPTSPSGYVMPLGLLNQAGVPIRSGAFLEGQASVVRAVYAADICDFGVTYIDARDLPALEADYPDVIDRVVVVWRSEAVIPYENISLAASLPIEMRRVLQRVFIDFMLTPDGKAAMQTIYGIDELQVVDDSMYEEFNIYVTGAKIELPVLLDELRP